MWLKDDDGNIVGGNSTTTPYFDLTQEYVRNYWVDASVGVIKEALARNISVDGILVDGMCPYVSYYGISSERNAQFQEGAIELMRLTNRKLKDIPPNMILIGNGLTHSTNPTMNYCRSVLNYTDGAMIEHFGAFEEVDTSTSMIYTDYWLDWIDIIYLC